PHAAPPPALYPLSLHDALPICACHRSWNTTYGRTFSSVGAFEPASGIIGCLKCHRRNRRGLCKAENIENAATQDCTCYRCWCCQDRKSTRLNSSHQIISYAVFC